MNESVFEMIAKYSRTLNLNLTVSELAAMAADLNMTESEMNKLCELFRKLDDRKHDSVVATCLRLSRLPLKQPKTFENFNFDCLKGEGLEKIKTLSSLAPLYEQRNLAFIGPQGIGKTHLAMAFGRKCCEQGIKTYFLKATELEQRLTEARKTGRVASVVNGLVKPSCLIIDEIGRCKFDKENTQLFFDIIDRRSSKDGPSCMIFTSNRAPDTWRDDFDEDDSLLCALDRIFDSATVFVMKGESYRGKKLETLAVETCGTAALLKKK